MKKLIVIIFLAGAIGAFTTGHPIVAAYLLVAVGFLLGLFTGHHDENLRWRKHYPDLEEPPPD